MGEPAAKRGVACRGGGWGCTAGRVGGAAQLGRVGGAAQQGAPEGGQAQAARGVAQQRGWAGLYSREGRWGSTEERVGGAPQLGGCTAGRVSGAAQQEGKVGGVRSSSPWPFPLPRLHPPLSMPSCPQIPSSTPTSSPYSIFLFADFDHWTRSLPRCNCMCVWRGTWVNLQ